MSIVIFAIETEAPSVAAGLALDKLASSRPGTHLVVFTFTVDIGPGGAVASFRDLS